MKKILIILCAVFICGAAIAQTIRWHIGDTVYQTTTCNAGESITPPTAPEQFGYSLVRYDAYTPIEYLESTGTQWIDTGVVPNNDTGVNIDVAWLGNFGGERQILGTRYNNDDVRFYVPFLYDGHFGYGWGSWSESNINCAIDTIYNIKFNYLNNRVITINNNDISILNSNLPQNTTGETLPLFAAFYMHLKLMLTGRIYKVQITKGTDLVRDFIPVLDGNGTPCMYDKVEHKFYYNAGTGQFIAGPVIVGE